MFQHGWVTGRASDPPSSATHMQRFISALSGGRENGGNSGHCVGGGRNKILLQNCCLKEILV